MARTKIIEEEPKPDPYSLKAMADCAIYFAKKFGKPYTVICIDPVDGLFDKERGSTFNFVPDTYFNNPHTNIMKVWSTDREKIDMIIPESLPETLKIK